jgi:hypothetical protein
MRPHPLELPLVWAPILFLSYAVATAIARGVTPPGASRAASVLIALVCYAVTGAALYMARRRYIPR